MDTGTSDDADATLTILSVIICSCLLINAVVISFLLFAAWHYFRRVTVQDILVYLYLVVENADAINRRDFD